jgi:hypothetical protein
MVTVYVPDRLPANEHVPELVPPAVSEIEAGHETVNRPEPAGPPIMFDTVTGPTKPVVVAGRLFTMTETWAVPPDGRVTLVEFVERPTPVM